MDKKLFTFKQFANEQEDPLVTGVTGSTDTPGKPETEREAKSRIATGIIKSLFGANVGLSGGVDSLIDQTKEVKESLPYRGCGASEPYKLEKNPISVMTIKILLNYLQEKKVGDYSKVIQELVEKRAVIIGIRNKLDVKKETSNQDRFTDALYFIPGNAKDGSGVTGPTGSTGSTGSTGTTLSDVWKNTKDAAVKYAENKKNKNKNESLGILEFIDRRISELENISESGLWSFEDFENINKERVFLIENRDLLESGEITGDEFIQLYEEGILGKVWGGLKSVGRGLVAGGKWVGKKLGLVGDDPKKNNQARTGDDDDDDDDSKSKATTTVPTGPTGPTERIPPASLGDKITPYQITTVPSLAYYGKKPMNPKGVGIKLPGQTLYIFQEGSLGSGTKYKMMVEGEPIKVGRYPIGVTKFESYKPAEVYTESCGMQIHRSSTKGVGICVGPWSAGCQVFADNEEWKDFISKAEKEQMNATKFYYGLIQLDDIPKEVMDDAMKGLVYQGAGVVASANTTGSTEATGSTGSNKKAKVLTNFGDIS